MDRTDPRNQSLPELISSLSEQVSKLVRAELALARAELFANARQAILGGGLLAAAAFVGLTAWLVMVAAAVAGIAEGLPVWAGALIIGGALAALAAALALLGRARLRRGMPPLPMTTVTFRKDLHELASRNGHNGDAPLPAQRTALSEAAPHEPAPGQVPARHGEARR
jgi:hypothetical protein